MRPTRLRRHGSAGPRSHRITAGVVLLAFGSLVALPVLPWVMGIVGDVQHSYTPEVPTTNRGTYVVTAKGAMQLFAWYVDPGEMPVDAPTLAPGDVQQIAVVQKVFAEPSDYRLFDLSRGTVVDWLSVSRSDGALELDPGPLGAGDYEVLVPTDGMFGGSTLHFFRLASDPAAGVTQQTGG